MTLDEFRDITKQGKWSSFAASLMEQQALTSEAVTHFGTCWIEAGHHIREQVADDKFLVRLLRKMLPPYKGEEMELFRGENRVRWESGSVGLAWTLSIDKARMFAGGLNAVRSGGVLLRAHVEPSSIISGPNTHSAYLGEAQITLDPHSLRNVSALEFFPPNEECNLDHPTAYGGLRPPSAAGELQR